jgi:hypothetical protein
MINMVNAIFVTQLLNMMQMLREKRTILPKSFIDKMVDWVPVQVILESKIKHNMVFIKRLRKT